MTHDESMTDVIDLNDFAADFQPLCEAKAEEFRLLGYEEVIADEVWACVKAKVKTRVLLHQAVSEIMSLNIGQFMNFMTMSAYKGSLPDMMFDAGNRS